MKKKLFFVLGGIVFLNFSLIAQEKFGAFMEMIKNEHPLAKAIATEGDMAQGKLLEARSAFDANLSFDLDRKDFLGKDYYSYLSGDLVVPTQLGIEMYAGYDQTEGLFLNPESTLPSEGLFHFGVKLPVLQGLFFDQRRFFAQRAHNQLIQTTLNQKLDLNQLLFNAGSMYVAWSAANQAVEVLRNGEQRALEQFEMVKQLASIGEKSKLDTVKAQMTYLKIALKRQMAEADWSNLSTLMTQYIFNSIQLRPDELFLIALQLEDKLTTDQNYVITNHPKVQNLEVEREILELEKRWAKEQFKPKLNLKYQMIAGNDYAFSADDYKYGVAFNFPLNMRKARGKLLQVRSKETKVNEKLRFETTSIESKVNQQKNNLMLLEAQVEILTKNVRNLDQLLQAETTLFSLGESELFVVNRRLLDYYDAELTLIKINAVVQKERLKLMQTEAILDEIF